MLAKLNSKDAKAAAAMSNSSRQAKVRMFYKIKLLIIPDHGSRHMLNARDIGYFLLIQTMVRGHFSSVQLYKFLKTYYFFGLEAKNLSFFKIPSKTQQNVIGRLPVGRL